MELLFLIKWMSHQIWWTGIW